MGREVGTAGTATPTRPMYPSRAMAAETYGLATGALV